MAPRKASGSSSSSSAGPSSSKPRKADKTTVLSSGSTSSDVPDTDAHLGLLIEYLTFNPRAFIDAVAYVANEGLYKLGDDLEVKVMGILTQAGVAEQDAARSAEKGVHSIRTLIENALDHVFDTLELYSLRNVFGLTERQASHIILPHHQGLDLRGKGADAVEDESTILSRQQRELNRKLNAAKATSHALKLAVEASDRRLVRTRAVHGTLATLLGFDREEAQEIGTVQEAAQRLLSDVEVVRRQREPLLVNVEKLRSVDPLGKALLHPTSTLSSSNVKSGEEDLDQLPEGREGYLRWQTQRLLSSNRMSLNGSQPGDEGDVTAADASAIGLKGGRKRKSTAADESVSGRKGARPSIPLHGADDGMAGGEIGRTTEMERLAALMQHRPATS